MLWFFERDEHSLHLETRYDDETSEYVVLTRYSDGREHIERFAQANKFRSWLAAFDQNLETQQWTLRSGGPVVLPDGWPDKWLT